MRPSYEGCIPWAFRLVAFSLVVLAAAAFGLSPRVDLPVHAASAAADSQGGAASGGICTALGGPICTAFTGVLDAAGSLLKKPKDKSKSTLDEKARNAVGPVVKLGDSLGVFRILLMRSYDARPYLENIRSYLLRPPDVSKLPKKEGGQLLDAYWAQIQAAWGQLSPYLIDLKSTDKHEVDNLFHGIHSEKVKDFVQGLVDAHLRYYAAIDSAVKVRDQAWLRQTTDGLAQLLAEGGPAAAAVFLELNEDTKQLSSWAAQAGNVPKGSNKEDEADKTRIAQIMDEGVKVPDPWRH